MIQPQDVNFYIENGYLLVKGVFNADEIQEMRDAIDRTIQRAANSRHDKNHLWKDAFSEEEQNSLVLKAFHDIHYHDASFLRALSHPNMASVLTRLIGPNVQLHHSKMLVKPPEKGGGFPMHQDYPYFPHANHTMLAASVHLDDADMENGCLCVVPKSHKLGPITTDQGNHLNREQYSLDRGTPCPAQAGDVLFFNYLTIHGSAVNRSNRTRRNVLFQYRDPADLPTVDRHVDWGQGLMVAGENPIFRDYRALVNPKR